MHWYDIKWCIRIYNKYDYNNKDVNIYVCMIMVYMYIWFNILIFNIIIGQWDKNTATLFLALTAMAKIVSTKYITAKVKSALQM